MEHTRRFQVRSDNGFEYLVVSCHHAAFRLRLLGFSEVFSFNRHDFLAVAIVPCQHRLRGCLNALIGDARHLHLKLGCRTDIALFSCEKGPAQIGVLHLNPCTIGPIDKLLERLWNGIDPEFNINQIDLGELLVLNLESEEGGMVETPEKGLIAA
jgi:hypothetical protein